MAMAKERESHASKTAQQQPNQSSKKKLSKKASKAGAGRRTDSDVKLSNKKVKSNSGEFNDSDSQSSMSSRSSDFPVPPPALLDLVNRFLSDFEYTEAVNGIHRHSYSKPYLDESTWESKSEGMPDLVKMFNEWQAQNPGRGEQGTRAPAASKPSKDQDMSVDEAKKEINGVVPGTIAAKQLKRKAAAMSSDTSDSESDSDSASSSDTSSDSDSDSDAEAQPAKKRKSGARPGESVISQKKPTKAAATSGSSSSDTSDSDSTLVTNGVQSGARPDTKSNKQDTNHIGATNRPNSSGSESDSESDSDLASSDDSSSSSSSESDASGGVPTKTSKLASSAPKDTSGSDTSSTLPYPSDTGTPAKAPYSTSGSSSGSSASSSSSSDSDSDDSIQYQLPTKKSKKAKADFLKSKAANASPSETTNEFLTFTTPASETASHKPETTTLPATASNVAKLKKKAVPFSRIPDNVKVDERFSSNKYVPYEYADRAYQDLSVTKGKGFTKEKNKKKRGAYRGGVIDLAGGKGVKFED